MARSKKINKEGLGPSEVANKTQKTTKNKKKRNKEKKVKNTMPKKELLNYQSIFLVGGGWSKNSLF